MVDVATEPQSGPTGGPTPDEGPSGMAGAFGPLTGLRVVVLLVAVAFLAGAVGYAVGDRHGSADPLSTTDVGFMRDMGYHHDQAVQMSIVLLGKAGLDPALRDYALEIIVGQRTEMGVFTALLDRYDHPSGPPKRAMTWMGGGGVPPAQMDGMASPAEMAALRNAKGAEADALWIAMMTEHHLGGMHMGDHEARHGKDHTVVNLARNMVLAQRGEVIDLQNYRKAHDLPIPKGFEQDPLGDQRLNPLSVRDALDARGD